MNWLRGGPKKREITTNSPPPVAEALLLISKEQNDIENLLDMRKNSDAHFYIPSSSNHSRGASPTFRDVPQLAIEAQPSTQPLQITSGKEYENDDEYMLPPLEDNIEVVPAEEKASNKGTEALGPNAGKKKSPKLRISALNILKVKGTSFRSKTPDEEGQQRRRDSVVCLLPFLLSNMVLNRYPTYRTHALPMSRELPSREATQQLVDRILLRVGGQRG